MEQPKLTLQDLAGLHGVFDPRDRKSLLDAYKLYDVKGFFLDDYFFIELPARVPATLTPILSKLHRNFIHLFDKSARFKKCPTSRDVQVYKIKLRP